jgi:hypothetical protein
MPGNGGSAGSDPGGDRQATAGNRDDDGLKIMRIAIIVKVSFWDK